MEIVKKKDLNELEKEVVCSLWNKHYPKQFYLPSLDIYLRDKTNVHHYLAVLEDSILGWLFTYDKVDGTWFALIVDDKAQNKGIGSKLLKSALLDCYHLNGWIILDNNLKRKNGSLYVSPLGFYLKQNFTFNKSITITTQEGILLYKISI